MASSKRETRNRQARKKRATAEMEKRLSDKLAGKEVIIVESADGVKMSEVLEAFIAPYMEYAETEESFEKLVSIAVIAWNISLLPRSAQTKAINDLLISLPPETRADGKSIIRDLMRRKRIHFSKIRRAIIEFEVTDTRDGFHLMVASTPENV